MTAEEIIEKGDNILYSTSYLDRIMFKRLTKFLANNTLGGKVTISNEDLAQLEDIIYKEIKDSNYEEDIAKYLGLITAIEDSVNKEQAKYNNIRAQAIKDLWGKNDIRTRLVDKIVYDLGAGGMKDYFVKGVAKVARGANYYNLTIDDAIDKLNKVLIEDEYTKRYIRQTSIDSLSQYKGAMNDAIREAYDLKNMLYVGNTIETSRPICTHIRDDLKGKISSEQLKQLLKEYCPNGKPSDKIITYETVSGEKHRAKKGAGMIEGTTFENFAQRRGGHQCRHEAIWVR